MIYRIVDLDQRTAEWHAWRYDGIGASDAAALMGENYFADEITLLADKTNSSATYDQDEGDSLVVPLHDIDLEEAEWEPMKTGALLEPHAREEYIQLFGLDVQPYCLESVEHPWMRASVDGLSPDGRTIVEIKCGQRNYNRVARSSEVPPWHNAQLQHILAITGLPKIDFFSYWPGRPAINIVVPRDDRYIAELTRTEAHFWDKVLCAREQKGIKRSDSSGAPTYLVIDCETNGLPLSKNAPLTDHSNWPRLVQVGWALHSSNGEELSSTCRIVSPDGFRIPSDAADIHGITTERALAEGHPLTEVLAELSDVMTQADKVVAHNASFDGSVIACEYYRLGLDPPFSPKNMICTMRQSTNFCRLPGSYGKKWPTLDELYWKLFEEEPEGAHDAGADARACARAFFELRRRGVITG